MKATLYFYKTAINLIDKNFVLESIESYLATLTPVTKTDFQYQRFELEKTIKVNMSQDYQLNIAGLTKYNYLKITTLDSSSPAKTATYYYFIKSARQISELTIEFTIVMDVLNTFQFSSTAANDKYTLSDKTLVKREHKDRLSKYDILNTFDLEIGSTASDLTNAYRGYLLFNPDSIALSDPEKPLTPQNTASVYIYSIDGVLSATITSSSGLLVGRNDYTILYIHEFGTSNYWYYDQNEFYIVVKINNEDEGDVVVINKNSFKYLNITQQHGYRRIIDYYQEGLSTILFKKKEEILYDEDEDNQWYIIYSSANAVTQGANDTAAKYVNPVEMRFYSDKGYSISTSSSHEVTLNATSPLIPKWVNTEEHLQYDQATASTLGDVYVKIGGNIYDFHDYDSLEITRKNNNDVTFKTVRIRNRGDSSWTTFEYVSSVTFYGINSLYVWGRWGNYTNIQINSGQGSYSGTADSWGELDLTDSKLIKALAFPYAPCEFLVGQDTFTNLPPEFTFNADNYIQLSNIQSYDLKYQKKFEVASPLSNINLSGVVIGSSMPRNIAFESKLFHSDYYQPKFVYDSFSFLFYLEYVNVDKVNESYLNLDSEFYATYVISRNIQSKFAFIFDEYYLAKGIQDYDNVLCIERNNEKALYNNAYINYVRSGGYSYDTKKASSQNAVNGITTALSIVGAVASFASSGATGGAGIAAGVGLSVAAATGIMRSIHTAQEQDKAISQKILQAQQQGTSVQGSEDIDILTAFSGNKAKLVYYELSDIMKNAMWDLFHYCGYATHEQKVPVVNTRLYFNFIQAEIVLKDFTFNEEIAKRIIEKWNQGVTFMHWVSGAYDLNQEYENFETSLL